MRKKRRAYNDVLFRGCTFFSLEEPVDECQRFDLLGGASSTCQARKKQICVFPPFAWLPSGKQCYGKLPNFKFSFSILIYNKYYCSLCTCTAATQMERALLSKIARVIDLVEVTASRVRSFKSLHQFCETEMLRKHKEFFFPL